MNRRTLLYKITTWMLCAVMFLLMLPPEALTVYAEEVPEEEFQFEVTVSGTSSADLTFAIPLSGGSGLGTTGFNDFKSYDWNIDWGDDSEPEIKKNTDSGAPQNLAASPGIPHTYSKAGTYKITIKPNGNTGKWLAAFGFYTTPAADNGSANIAANKEKMTKIITPLTPLMTRTQAQISGDVKPPHCEWRFAFYKCTNLTMDDDFNFAGWDGVTTVGDYFASSMFSDCTNLTMNDKFNLPQKITTVGNDFASSMFSRCTNLTMNDTFNLPPGIITVGYRFAYSMFSSCTNLTMNDIFNLPQELTTVGNTFASGIFSNCTGPSFTMNDIFNLPQELTTVGNAFAENMFYKCTGASFAMNDKFNLPQKLTTVGTDFASSMFWECTGASFTMNDKFNLPQKLTTVGNNFAYYMFYGCSSASFAMNDKFNLPQEIDTVGTYFAANLFSGCTNLLVNDVFMFPKLDDTNLIKSNVYYRTFYTVTKVQFRTAKSIIGNNDMPNNNRFTFTNATGFADLAFIDTKWGGTNTVPTDAQKAKVDLDSLTFDVIKKDNTVPDNITGDLNLIQTGDYGSTITWLATPTGWINTDTGEVTQPPGRYKRVTLTATAKNGNASETKQFDLTVIGDGSGPIIEVDIVWSALNYTCTPHTWNDSTHQWENYTYTPSATDSDLITVQNKGEEPVTLSFTFAPTVAGVIGTFKQESGGVTTLPLSPESDPDIIKLNLSGTPLSPGDTDKTMGTVTIQITD